MARKKQTVYAKESPIGKKSTPKTPQSGVKIIDTKRKPIITSLATVPSPEEPSSDSSSIASGGSSQNRRSNSPNPIRDVKNHHKKHEPLPTTVASSSIVVKCSKCGSRQARKGCSHNACLACCIDLQCEVHKESRDLANWKEKVLGGKTTIQKKAKEKRSKLLNKGRFRESEFVYLGDTVMIWNIHEYIVHSKWKEDALRKASRRNARADHGYQNSTTNNGNNNKQKQKRASPNTTTTTPTTTQKSRMAKVSETVSSSSRHPARCRVKTGQKRFQRIMEDLYQKSLKD